MRIGLPVYIALDYAGHFLKGTEKPQTTGNRAKLTSTRPLRRTRIERNVLGMLNEDLIAVFEQQGERTKWNLAKQTRHFAANHLSLHKMFL